MINIEDIADTDVAVVGMAGRFPGANNPDELWRRVAAGEDCLTDLDDETLIANGVAPSALDDTYVGRNGLLDDVEGFDHDFFGIGSRDASIMDPQHRHFLEICWEALESAAIVPESFDGAIGVFGGCGANTYLLNNLLSDPSLMDRLGWFLLRHTGNDKDFFVNNVAYQLGLTGPAVNVQTACSTSLVSVHLAAQSLINFECDAALAGGSTIEVPHGVGYRYREGEILSPDGRCRAFDADSKGTVLTSGTGVVLLRRLADAVEDGDPILAVVKATAINNDGARKVGFLAPSVDGHADVVREALALADLTGRDIGLVDAHGTGTAVGDPIEVAALTEAFRASTDESGFCRLTSTKPNIGHLDTAAGVASLIKTIQALRHRTLPPIANHTAPSPLLNIERTPFQLSAEATPWETDGVRRAGVSSLGVGGTNAHVILEEAPELPTATPVTDERPRLVLMSAESSASLKARAVRLADAVEANPELDVASIVSTQRTGRRTMPHRMALAVRPSHLLEDLRNTERGLRSPAISPGQRPRLGFVFPGGGSQYPGMGQGFGPEFDVYHAAIAELRELFLDLAAPDLNDLLDPAHAADELARPTESLPAVFSVTVAMARQWMALGAEPDFLLGHSLGEYAAAHLAGVMSLEAAASLVAGRSVLMEKVSGNNAAMLVVPETEDAVNARLTPTLSLATVNAPDECAVAGPRDEILALAAKLEAEGTPGSVIPIDVAAHSSVLDPILPDFLELVQRVDLKAPERPILSNVTGTWMTAEQASSATYWVDHLRRTVRFADGLRTAVGDEPTVIAEIGPGHTLSSYARRNSNPPLTAIPSMRHADATTDDSVFAHTALGRLWTVEVPVDLDTLAPIEAERRSTLPVYGFDHQHCWIERSADAVISTTGDTGSGEDSGIRRLDSLEDMTWVRRWQPAEAPTEASVDRDAQWVVVGDLDDSLVTSLASALAARVTVTTIDARNPSLPDEIDGAVLVSSPQQERPSQSRWLTVAPELARRVGEAGGRYVAVTRGALDADGLASAPADAMALGAAKVVGAEYPGTAGVVIDLLPEAEVDDAVLDDLFGSTGVIAHRSGGRLSSVLEAESFGDTSLDVSDTVQLVTGALGGVGSVLADHLARSGASLAVVTSSPLPPEAEHDAWLATHALDDSTSRRIRRLRELRSVAERVEVVVADLDTPEGVHGAVRDAVAAFGRVDGILHAAGRLHDELIGTLDIDAARGVIAPKADASLAFQDAAAASSVDRLTLVSSTSTELAPIGQLAYVGANAVLDAMVGERDGVKVSTVGFGLWADVGMASDAGARMRLDLGAGERFDHPIFGEIHRSDDDTQLVGRLDATHSWVVDEHRTIDGAAVLPGTGHLDLMTTAAAAAGAPLALAEVELLGPVVVGDNPVWIRAVVDGGDQPMVRVESDLGGGEWTTHSTAQLVPAEADNPLSAPAGNAASVDLFADQRAALLVGPRWTAAAELIAEGSSAMATITTESAAGESERWTLHPALADLATAVGVTLRLGEGLHVPTGYESVTVHRPLADTYRVVANRRDESTVDELIVDIDLLVEDVTAAQLRGLRLLALEPAALAPADTTTRRRNTGGGLVAIADEVGLRPAEGTELLARLLDSDHGYGLISSVDLDALRALDDIEDDAGDPDAPVAASVEDEVAAIFGDLLGLDDVPSDADFFDLGGHSLLAIRLTSRLQSAMGVRVQIAALADASNVERLSALLRELKPGIDAEFAERASSPAGTASADEVDDVPTKIDAANWRSLVPISREGEGRPLYVVHGAGGNVLFLMPLARGLAGDRPLFGFQAKGSEGGLMPDPTIEAMAERYVDELVAHDDGPYLIGGFSGGGMVALEMSKLLRDRGKDVEIVLLFDTPIPGELHPGFVSRWTNVVRAVMADGPSAVRSYVRRRIIRQVRRIRPANDRRSEQREDNDRMLGYRSVSDLFWHFTATGNRYVPSSYPADVALIRADEVRPSQPGDYGWGRHIEGDLQLLTSPGDHHSMFYPENAGALAEKVRKALDSVDAD